MTSVPNPGMPASASSSTPMGKKPVPAGAAEFKGHHYKLFTDGADWDKASFRCRTLSGHLAVITSDDENGFVYAIMRGQAAAWIGASKDLGTWQWCSPVRFEFQNWAPGEPNGGKVRDLKGCIYGERHESARGRWDDRPGNNPEVTGYVCEWDY